LERFIGQLLFAFWFAFAGKTAFPFLNNLKKIGHKNKNTFTMMRLWLLNFALRLFFFQIPFCFGKVVK